MQSSTLSEVITVLKYAEVAWVLVSLGTQFQSQIILGRDYLPNYSSVSYDYDSVTLGESVFPRLSWLIKCFNENALHPKDRHFSKNLCSAKIVTENAYGMLKGRWRFIYKNYECKLDNMKYVQRPFFITFSFTQTIHANHVGKLVLKI